MPLCWIFLLKRRRALSKVSFSPTRTSANPESPPTGGVSGQHSHRCRGSDGGAHGFNERSVDQLTAAPRPPKFTCEGPEPQFAAFGVRWLGHACEDDSARRSR